LGSSARQRLLIVILLAVLGAGVSGLLLLQHHGEGDVVNQLCGDAQTSGCAEVARSSWSRVAGMPLAALGLFFYLALGAGLVLAWLAPEDARDAIAFLCFVVTGLALAIDVALLAVQAFSIRAFCWFCLITYAVNGGILAALWPTRRTAAGVRPAAARPEGRLAVAAWAVAVLAIGAAVGSAEAALRARAARRADRLLGGAPAAGAPVTPALESPSAPADASDAQRWQAEARRLQQILDDPQKLDQYFTEKAAREFEEAKPQPIDLRDVPSKGPPNAPVQVVEYSDFLCPFCRNLAGALTGFLPQSGDRVALYYKNFPLDQACNPKLRASTHLGACWLALGAICAHAQGRFWPYHDKVFGSQLQNPQPADVVRLAREAGLDAAALERCLPAPQTKEKLQAQIDEAQKLGVQATPTLFINGKKLPRINDFIQMVDKEAQAKGLPPLQPGAPMVGRPK
jgi:protein-disulfide isomerase/uncharacterized membrane protein